jgi:hypothetical protein
MNRLHFFALTVCLGFLVAQQASASCTATATYQCYGQGTLSCSGATTCSLGPTWVQCDGVRTDCPACEVEADCSYRCPGASVVCYSDVGRCSKTFNSVQCDGNPRVYCSQAICSDKKRPSGDVEADRLFSLFSSKPR